MTTTTRTSQTVSEALGSELVTGGAFTAHATGVVTQANMRLSAVAGTAFIDFSAADVLTDHIGKILTVKDSAGKVLVGYIKAAGTGETLGSELHTSANAASDPNGNEANATTGWSGGTLTSESADPSVGTYYLKDILAQWEGIISSPFATVAKGLFKVTTDIKIISGPWEQFVIMNAANTATIKLFLNLYDASAYTSYPFYWTSVAANERFRAMAMNVAGAEIYLDNFSLKQILIPSTTGVTIVSTPGGATYNWTYQEAGFNYNDVSNYTYEIYDTDFEYGTGWYPSSNTAQKVAGTASALEQDVSAVATKIYRIVHTATRTAGSETAEVGGTDGAARSTAATFTDNVRTATTGNLKIGADASFAGTIDAFSCKQITRRAAPD